MPYTLEDAAILAKYIRCKCQAYLETYLNEWTARMISSLISPEKDAAVKKQPISNSKFQLLMRDTKMIFFNE